MVVVIDKCVNLFGGKFFEQLGQPHHQRSPRTQLRTLAVECPGHALWESHNAPQRLPIFRVALRSNGEPDAGPDLVLSSVAELAEPSADLLSVVPSGDDSDDSVHDLQEWVQSAS